MIDYKDQPYKKKKNQYANVSENANSLKLSIPSDIDTEKAILASIIVDSSTIIKVVDRLRVDYFYFELHALIYHKILILYEKDIPIDLLTIYYEIKEDSILEKMGGIEYLQRLTELVPSISSIDYYVKILEDKYQSRALIEASNQIIQMALSQEDSDSILDKAELKIFEITQKKQKKGFIHIKDSLKESLELIQHAYNQDYKYSGVQSGFTDLDNYTGGFQNSDLIIIAARPSMGKTSLALNILEYVSLKLQKSVAFFSLEMSNTQIVYRLLSTHLKMDSNRLKRGLFGSKEFVEITSSMDKLEKASIYIDDMPSISNLEIRTKLRKLLLKEDIALVIIDYLQLISTYERRIYDNRQVEIAQISKSLKNLAREFNIPIIALSQLSRMVEIRTGDHRPRLSDLRDSGAIEQDADLVLFIYRDEYYSPNKEDNKGKAELIIAKHRNGPTGTVNLTFHSTYARFLNWINPEKLG